jgi:hypothetical protein
MLFHAIWAPDRPELTPRRGDEPSVSLCELFGRAAAGNTGRATNFLRSVTAAGRGKVTLSSLIQSSVQAETQDHRAAKASLKVDLSCAGYFAPSCFWRRDRSHNRCPTILGVACHYIHVLSKAYTSLSDYTESTIYEYYIPDCMRTRESPMSPWEMNEYEKLQNYLRPPERR